MQADTRKLTERFLITVPDRVHIILISISEHVVERNTFDDGKIPRLLTNVRNDVGIFQDGILVVIASRKSRQGFEKVHGWCLGRGWNETWHNHGFGIGLVRVDIAILIAVLLACL
jgi:hypothetical protein